MSAFDAVSTVGAILILVAYFLLQSGKLDPERGYAYTVLNLFGSIFIVISLFGSFNLGAAIINVAWVFFSVFGLVRIRRLRAQSC